ncbi:MAG: class I SAM-dependent methyltransferase [Pseudomonadota bacterium]|nr:class I SAM-dependent methyltransferase [Pseudomonadota bacterium]
MTHFDNVNETVLAEIPLDARRIGELGCGAGAMARVLRSRQEIPHYVGIDVVHDQLANASQWLDVAIEVDLNAVTDWSQHVHLSQLPEGSFDCWVAGDVLEHLIEPEHAIKEMFRALRPGGKTVICVPNVQNWQTFVNLVQGSWPRDDAGLFDRTHLRWFTRNDMAQFLVACGFRVEKCLGRQFGRAQGEEVLEFLEPLCGFLGVDYEAFFVDGLALQHVFVASRPVKLNHADQSR